MQDKVKKLSSRGFKACFFCGLRARSKKFAGHWARELISYVYLSSESACSKAKFIRRVDQHGCG